MGLRRYQADSGSARDVDQPRIMHLYHMLLRMQRRIYAIYKLLRCRTPSLCCIRLLVLRL